MPRRLPLAASVILCRQPKYGALARQVCVRLPLGGGLALRDAEPPKSDGWPKTISSRGARICGASRRWILWQARGTRRCCALRRVPGAAQEQALVRLRQAALRRAESRARISATVRENDDYQRFIPEVREFFPGEVVDAHFVTAQ